MYIDNIRQNGLWGCDPKPYEYEAFVGYRAIYCTYRNGRPYIDYLWDRQCARGEKRDLAKLVKWWTKRGGIEAKWLRSQNRLATGPIWTYGDPKTGNTAHVKRSDGGYVYISLYHSTPHPYPIAQ